MIATYSNTQGNKLLKVYGPLNGTSKTHYEAELFVNGVSEGLEAITPAQVKHRYPIFVGAELKRVIAV